MEDCLIVQRLKDARAEARRFDRRAELALAAIRDNEMAAGGCKETAAAKRASMDLSRALSELRKGSTV